MWFLCSSVCLSFLPQEQIHSHTGRMTVAPSLLRSLRINPNLNPWVVPQGKLRQNHQKDPPFHPCLQAGGSHRQIRLTPSQARYFHLWLHILFLLTRHAFLGASHPPPPFPAGKFCQHLTLCKPDIMCTTLLTFVWQVTYWSPHKETLCNMRPSKSFHYWLDILVTFWGYFLSADDG